MLFLVGPDDVLPEWDLGPVSGDLSEVSNAAEQVVEPGEQVDA